MELAIGKTKEGRPFTFEDVDILASLVTIEEASPTMVPAEVMSPGDTPRLSPPEIINLGLASDSTVEESSALTETNRSQSESSAPEPERLEDIGSTIDGTPTVSALAAISLLETTVSEPLPNIVVGTDILDLPDNIEDPSPLIVPEHEVSNLPDNTLEASPCIVPAALMSAGDKPSRAFPTNNKDPSSSIDEYVSVSKLETFIAEATLFKTHPPERAELPARHMDAVELSVDPAKTFALPDKILEPERDVLTCDVIPSVALTPNDPAEDISPASNIREFALTPSVATPVICEPACISPLPETIFEETGDILASATTSSDAPIVKLPSGCTSPVSPTRKAESSIRELLQTTSELATIAPFMDTALDEVPLISELARRSLPPETILDPIREMVPASRIRELEPSPRDAPTENSEVDSIEQPADNILPIPACSVPEVCIVACP
jgi:hypothetical protein